MFLSEISKNNHLASKLFDNGERERERGKNLLIYRKKDGGDGIEDFEIELLRSQERVQSRKKGKKTNEASQTETKKLSRREMKLG